MTSKQVMLTLAVIYLTACAALPRRGADPLVAPYGERRVWAVAPLRNESGSLSVDTAALADHLARHLENAENLDVLPVNRVLAAMDAMRMAEIITPADALKVLNVLQCDGLIVGTVTSYDPYDPPKLGMAIELFTSQRFEERHITDVRAISSAATDTGPLPAIRQKQPVTVISAYFDAADPDVRRKIARYATDRRVTRDPDFVFQKNEEQPERMYRISMDLYSEFVSYVMSWRLLHAETIRLAPPPTTAPATR
ncbi:MAG: hypothetical protein IT444_04860 [Phycisphaeraceae bacterium]|nr:hypothetical protein [Phycisphaeraceae bacterium]